MAPPPSLARPPLLVDWGAFLLLDALLEALDRVARLDVDRDRLARERPDENLASGAMGVCGGARFSRRFGLLLACARRKSHNQPSHLHRRFMLARLAR